MLDIEMHNPYGQILRELSERKATQDSVATTYAYLIVQEWGTTNWSEVNQAIRARWEGKTALTRIKTKAWQQIDRWGKPESK
jgi:hypothetical protein